MKYCTYCGKELSVDTTVRFDGMKICKNCGCHVKVAGGGVGRGIYSDDIEKIPDYTECKYLRYCSEHMYTIIVIAIAWILAGVVVFLCNNVWIGALWTLSAAILPAFPKREIKKEFDAYCSDPDHWKNYIKTFKSDYAVIEIVMNVSKYVGVLLIVFGICLGCLEAYKSAKGVTVLEKGGFVQRVQAVQEVVEQEKDGEGYTAYLSALKTDVNTIYI